MRISVVLLLAVFALTGCSAASLKKAEEKTWLAGQTSPLGMAIHLPFFVASSIAGVASEPEIVVEKREPWRIGLPGDISKEEYEALSDKDYLWLMAKVHQAKVQAARAAREAGIDPATNVEVEDLSGSEPQGIDEEEEPKATEVPDDVHLSGSAALKEVARN